MGFDLTARIPYKLIVTQAGTSGPRIAERTIKKAKRSNGTPEFIPHEMSTGELDTRLDMICAGNNFRPLVYTGQCCQVSGFHSSFDTLNDVPVATVATAYQHPSGVVYILIIHEALYFGRSLDHSLINPNQIRASEIGRAHV